MKDLSNIRKIILFGSVARDEAIKESDVDIFIDVKEENAKIEKIIRKISEDFYKTRDALIFKNKGINNRINVIVGEIERWPKLKESIESYGIVLYGTYTSSGYNGKKHFIVSWDNIKKNRGAFLNALYGYKTGRKRYSGLVEKYGGRKLGKSSIMISTEYRKDIFRLIKKYGVSSRIVEVYVNEKST